MKEIDIEKVITDSENTINMLKDGLRAGLISQYAYDELLSIDEDEYTCLSSIEEFKNAYTKRKPIKCSELLLRIYDEHKLNFKKAILLSNSIPDPLGYKYDNNEYIFFIEIIQRSYTLATQNNYPNEFVADLQQIYMFVFVLYNNNCNNIKKLKESDFDKYTLSAQIRMICIHMQDQSRIIDKLNNHKGYKYITGMEPVISDINIHDTNTTTSIIDNYEMLIDNYDTLIRYIYFSKSKDLEKLQDHGDITHLYIPSFEMILYLAHQRVFLTNTWEKFKYSQWRMVKDKSIENNDVFIIYPENDYEYKQHIIASNRRNYLLVTEIMRNSNYSLINQGHRAIMEISETIDINNLESLIGIDKNIFISATNYVRPTADAIVNNMPIFYKDLIFKDKSATDLLNMNIFLQTISEIYKESVYRFFDEKDMSHYKYLSPIISLNILSKVFSGIYSKDLISSQELLNMYVFHKNIKGEHDLFSKPLISIGNDLIIFCSTLIAQTNYHRFLDLLLIEYGIDFSSTGKIFENKLKLALSFIPYIKVNTNKLVFKAYDGKDVEFDFFAMIGNHLIVMEFKSLLTPYDDKHLCHCRSVIRDGVDQVNRRCSIVQHDWDKLRELCSFQLPDSPIQSGNIIKVVCTNIFDFTSLVFEGVRVTDQSTLLKFFIDPSVNVTSVEGDNRKVISSERIWDGELPSADELINYLSNPIATKLYRECTEEQIKVFNYFDGDHIMAFYDYVMTKDPYREAIESSINSTDK